MKLDVDRIQNIVFLTGAGISQESGIKTFRDQNGLWEKRNIEEVATPEAYASNPALVHRFYNLRREQLKEVEPNGAHRAIGKLSQCQKFNTTVVTQNVDDLHERGGCEKVIHMHGELRKIRNIESGESKWFEGSVPEEDFKTWRPDIVWFGEQVKAALEIEEAIEQADLFVAVGTSSQVYPAAGLVGIANAKGIPSVELNLEQTLMTSSYAFSRQGRASELAPAFIRDILGVEQ